MRKENLEHKLVYLEGDTRIDLLNALRELAQSDNDFNGTNGELWNDAKEKGFKSNLDYTLHIIRNIPNPLNVITAFITIWMDNSQLLTT